MKPAVGFPAFLMAAADVSPCERFGSPWTLRVRVLFSLLQQSVIGSRCVLTSNVVCLAAAPTGEILRSTSGVFGATAT